MNDNTAGQDLAYLKNLAEAAEQSPPLGGRYLAWWGGLISVAYLLHHLVASGTLGLSVMALTWLWLGTGILGYLGHAVLLRSFPANKPGEGAIGNRVERAVWTAGGMVLLTYFVALAAKSLWIGAAAPGLAFSLPLVFATYGIAMFTTGTLAQSGILRWAGKVALALVPISVLLTGFGLEWLIASLGAACCGFVPGVLLLRQEPRAV